MMKRIASHPTSCGTSCSRCAGIGGMIGELARLQRENAQLRQQADDYRMEADALGDLLDAATAILNVPEVAAVVDAIAAQSETTRTPAAYRAPGRMSRRCRMTRGSGW